MCEKSPIFTVFCSFFFGILVPTVFVLINEEGLSDWSCWRDAARFHYKIKLNTRLTRFQSFCIKHSIRPNHTTLDSAPEADLQTLNSRFRPYFHSWLSDWQLQTLLLPSFLPGIYLLRGGGNLDWEVGGFNPFGLSGHVFLRDRKWQHTVGKGMGNSKIRNNRPFWRGSLPAAQVVEAISNSYTTINMTLHNMQTQHKHMSTGLRPDLPKSPCQE